LISGLIPLPLIDQKSKIVIQQSAMNLVSGGGD
jgi:hypothetical protein